MAYGATNLHLGPVAPGNCTYWYRTSDALATVLPIQGTGYFTVVPGSTPGPQLAVNDMIYCQCSDGSMWVKVTTVNTTTGAVVTQYAGGDLPIRTWATGTAAGDQGLSVGFYEVGTSVSTSSRGVLPVPYPGAQVRVRKIDSGTQGHEFDAGGSASNQSWVDGTVGGGTIVTYEGTNRRITLRFEGEGFHVVGTSTSRWRLYGFDNVGTGDGCASVYPEGASFGIAATV